MFEGGVSTDLFQADEICKVNTLTPTPDVHSHVSEDLLDDPNSSPPVPAHEITNGIPTILAYLS